MSDRKKKVFLKKVPLFSEITDKELEKIIKLMNERKYRKGTYMFFENEQGDTLFIIVSGLVKIYKTDMSGKVKTLTYLGEGDFFGEMAMLDEEIRSASAQVMEDTRVYILQRNNFQKEMLKNPKVSLTLLKTLSARLRSANKHIEDITFRNLPGRVATTLLSLADKHGVQIEKGVKINLRLTHQELSEIIGTAREVVTAILSDFRKSKAIKIEGHFIIITNKDELKSWIR